MNSAKKNDIISTEDWKKRLEHFPFNGIEMNKLIMNYFITEGYKEAAEKFKEEAEIKVEHDLSTLDARILIRTSVENGNIKKAIHLVNELHPTIFDEDRWLYFHLQQLHLIELIRSNKLEEALSFTQTRIFEPHDFNCDMLCDLGRTLTLLAFENPEESPYKELLSQSHRYKIASELNVAILKQEQHVSTKPIISNLIKLVLWAQSKLDEAQIKYPYMVDLESALIEPK